MKYSFLILLLVSNSILVAQNTNDSFEKYPVFPDCEAVAVDQLTECFNTQLRKHILENFNSTVVAEGEELRTTMTVFFEVDKSGEFQVLYIDVIEDELKEELRRVFELLPTIQPATYSGNPTYMQFTMPLQFPLNNNNWTLYSPPPTDSSIGERQISSIQNEYDEIEKLPYAQDEYD
ncbi:MAG: gliding motility protein RemB, partial [Flavobacteriaceae bacterium]|nr:gliding motility protein RemB [Flavobacteriaceae bacterium]